MARVWISPKPWIWTLPSKNSRACAGAAESAHAPASATSARANPGRPPSRVAALPRTIRPPRLFAGALREPGPPLPQATRPRAWSNHHAGASIAKARYRRRQAALRACEPRCRWHSGLSPEVLPSRAPGDQRNSRWSAEGSAARDQASPLAGVRARAPVRRGRFAVAAFAAPGALLAVRASPAFGSPRGRFAGLAALAAAPRGEPARRPPDGAGPASRLPARGSRGWN